ncbi:MAG TPA: AMP-binding protein [Steroidobacteraceae bacterium]|nr:AMP-binding protein [Steroidobacteraceae bacterium]
MDTIALLSHSTPSAVVAYRAGVPVTAQRFLSDAKHLAIRLPPGNHLLNVCADRYRFTVGLAACLITGRVSLLPSTYTPEVIGQLAVQMPDAVCLTDDARCDIDLPRVHYPEDLPGADFDWAVPEIPVTQLAAVVFTSGSTGTPLPYRKTWGRIARCVRDGAPRLGLLDGRTHALIGTVPAQHMYGFESTVLLALLSGSSFGAERPFYPADVAAAMAAVPQPRVLVTTPVHLRTLLASAVDLPPVDLIVSATAPLNQDLARDVEAKFRTTLLEIYGSTETGQIATRHTAESAAWRLWPGVRLRVANNQVLAQGGHVEQLTVMCDVIEITGDDEFLLHGRSGDLVNVAGKRSSFGYLNAQLNAIPGVTDGVFFLREGATGSTGVERLGAVVVAPTMSVAALTEHLRQRIDAVFLPRPLIMVDRLPRNATGKVPQQALQHLADRHLQSATVMHCALEVPGDHPAFAGHFPNFPILPGAVLLDEALKAIERGRGIDLRQWQIASAKFLDRVRPGDALHLEHEAAESGLIRFTIRAASRTVARGSLSTPRAAP